MQCEKAVAKNHKRCVCTTCFDFTHVKCAQLINAKYVSARTPKEWICPECAISVLAFHMDEVPELDNKSIALADAEDTNKMYNIHLQALVDKNLQLKIMHINTQSMVSTFDGLLAILRQYPFDIITMSETWLKDNDLLLQHVTILGYCHAFQQ